MFQIAFITKTHANAQPVKLMFAVLAQSLIAVTKQNARLSKQEANYCFLIILYRINRLTAVQAKSNLCQTDT